MIRVSNFWMACLAILVLASVLAVSAAEDEREGDYEHGEKKVSLDSLSKVVRETTLSEAGGRETEIHIGADGSVLAKNDKGAAHAGPASRGDRPNGEFTSTFGLEKCTFAATGRNDFFVLEPGYQLTLEHKDGDESGQLVITVLNETENVDGIETRVVEERESDGGQLIEVSRNYFAFCNETQSIFYFGEQTTKYKNGQPGPANDSWRADGTDCKPGLAMPGLILLGSRYQQEFDPKAAMDRAEIVGLDETLVTPAGTFQHCLKVEESNPLEGNEKEYKIYAPGIGLVQDEDLVLTRYGKV